MICQMKEQVITMSTDHVHASFVYNIKYSMFASIASFVIVLSNELYVFISIL